VGVTSDAAGGEAGADTTGAAIEAIGTAGTTGEARGAGTTTDGIADLATTDSRHVPSWLVRSEN
jgi:hypothetical protein